MIAVADSGRMLNMPQLYETCPEFILLEFALSIMNDVASNVARCRINDE